MNSYHGSMETDRGTWTTRVSESLGKRLLYCCKHESEHIFKGAAGLDEFHRNKFMSDCFDMLYGISSIEGLEQKFTNCLMTYGHNPSSKSYLGNLHKVRDKLCKAYTQSVFSMLHNSTQRSEGKNAAIKGNNTDLKAFITNSDLTTLHEHLDHINFEADKRALKMLVSLRESNKRWSWSNWFESHATQSKAMVMDNVKDCTPVDNDENYIVTMFNGTITRVNLKTKIIHRGVSYTIPTCTCGFWCSSFVPCKYIARALNARGLEVLSVNHVHPYHLVQLHPLWDNALKNCKRANYDDFGNSIQGKCNI